MAYIGKVPSAVPLSGADIPANSIDASKLVDGSITLADIADDAVTADKLHNDVNTAIAANTAKTGITSNQASAITANTAKTGITSGQASAITANTAKVTNATHTGDVTGSTALTIAADAVDIGMLSATGTPGSGNFLRGDNTWATAGSTSASDLTSGTLPIARIANDAITTAKLNLISTSSTPSIEARSDGTTDGYIQLNCTANSHGIKLKSPPHSAGASYTLTFPNDDGNANQKLTTNGSGVLTWTDDSTTVADGSISTAKIADDALNSEHYTDASVDFAHIQNLAANTVVVRDANSSGVASAKAVTNTQILIGDGTGFTAAALSGDATMTNAGVVTIAATAIEGSMLNNNVISGQTALASGIADTDELMISDAGTLKRVDASVFKTFLGAASIDDATALAIALG